MSVLQTKIALKAEHGTFQMAAIEAVASVSILLIYLCILNKCASNGFQFIVFKSRMHLVMDDAVVVV